MGKNIKKVLRRHNIFVDIIECAIHVLWQARPNDFWVWTIPQVKTYLSWWASCFSFPLLSNCNLLLRVFCSWSFAPSACLSCDISFIACNTIFISSLHVSQADWKQNLLFLSKKNYKPCSNTLVSYYMHDVAVSTGLCRGRRWQSACRLFSASEISCFKRESFWHWAVWFNQSIRESFTKIVALWLLHTSDNCSAAWWSLDNAVSLSFSSEFSFFISSSLLWHLLVLSYRVAHELLHPMHCSQYCTVACFSSRRSQLKWRLAVLTTVWHTYHWYSFNHNTVNIRIIKDNCVTWIGAAMVICL